MPNELTPLIRHCKNCQWCGGWFGGASEDITCRVKYKHISDSQQRFKALFCRHYKKKLKEGVDNG